MLPHGDTSKGGLLERERQRERERKRNGVNWGRGWRRTYSVEELINSKKKKKKGGQNEIMEMNEGVDCGLESPEHLHMAAFHNPLTA